jgi:hypothetical protein
MRNSSYFLGQVRGRWACLSISTVTRCAARCSGRVTQTLFVRPLSFPSHVLAADHVTALEYPYVTALLQDQTIVVHEVESQEVVQTVPAPPLPSPSETSLMALLGAERRALATSSNGFFVPSEQQSEKLALRKVNLLNRNAKPGGREVVPTRSVGGEETQEPSYVAEDATGSGVLAVESSARSASPTPYDV